MAALSSRGQQSCYSHKTLCPGPLTPGSYSVSTPLSLWSLSHVQKGYVITVLIMVEKSIVLLCTLIATAGLELTKRLSTTLNF